MIHIHHARLRLLGRRWLAKAEGGAARALAACFQRGELDARLPDDLLAARLDWYLARHRPRPRTPARAVLVALHHGGYLTCDGTGLRLAPAGREALREAGIL